MPTLSSKDYAARFQAMRQNLVDFAQRYAPKVNVSEESSSVSDDERNDEHHQLSTKERSSAEIASLLKRQEQLESIIKSLIAKYAEVIRN